jgi:hypothetical protein
MKTNRRQISCQVNEQIQGIVHFEKSFCFTCYTIPPAWLLADDHYRSGRFIRTFKSMRMFYQDSYSRSLLWHIFSLTNTIDHVRENHLKNKQTRTPTTYSPLGIGFLFIALIPPFISSSENL